MPVITKVHVRNGLPSHGLSQNNQLSGAPFSHYPETIVHIWVTVFNTEAQPYSHYIQLMHRIPLCHIVAALPKLSLLASFTRSSKLSSAG